MKVLVLDFETSYASNMPWMPDSHVVSLCLKFKDEIKTWIFNHDEKEFEPPTKSVTEIQEFIDKADLIVAHNLKFELHWLRHLDIDVSKKMLYCTMVAEYLLSGQTKKFADLSLATLSKEYGIPDKIDKVKEWWDSGYETCEIPLSTLIPYGEQDVLNCEAIFRAQVKKIHELKMHQLVKLRCESLRVTQEIEWNGMMLNTELCASMSEDIGKRIDNITDKIKAAIKIELPELEPVEVNFNSNDQLSAILFGGKVWYDGRVEGKRAGTTKKGKLCVDTNGLGFQPREGTETAKQGYYQTDIAQLDGLKPKKGIQQEFLSAIAELSKLNKVKGTYCDGLLERQIDMYVHPTINECATATGRYSSQNPNGQNFPRAGGKDSIKQLFITRYT